MKKVTIALIIMLCAAGQSQAIKPVKTDGFDRFSNGIKLDLASGLVLTPQVEWEYFSKGRFTIGAFAKAYVVDRSSLSTQFDSKEAAPKEVVLHGTQYNVNWDNSPFRMWGEVQMDGGTYGNTHEVLWDRRFTGVTFGPEGRFYFGSKPHRGFYCVTKLGLGIFRESFDIYASKKSLEDEEADRQAGIEIEDRWEYAGKENGDFKFAFAAGAGLGFQAWFKRNSHWGIDCHTVVKGVWGSMGEGDQGFWEWFLGPGFPLDINAAIVYRF